MVKYKKPCVSVNFAIKHSIVERQLWKQLNDKRSDLLLSYNFNADDSVSKVIKAILLDVMNGSNTGVKITDTTERKEPITNTIKEEKPNKRQAVNTENKNNLLNPLDEAATLSLDDLA